MVLAIAVAKRRIHSSSWEGFTAHLDLSILQILFKVPNQQ